MTVPFLHPRYELDTIANVPATVAGWLGVDFAGLPRLGGAYGGNERAKRVVLLVVDALGQNLRERYEELFAPLVATAVYQHTLTSVFPSTTVNALTCLWTGVAPATHGLVGLNLFFPTLGTVGNMLSLSPIAAKVADSLTKPEVGGIKPELFLPVPGLAEQLAAGGVPTYAFRPEDITDSVLSKIHGRGVAQNYGATTFADMLVQIRHLLEDPKTPERLFISAYWPTIDSLSHAHGPLSPIVAAELDALLYQIRHLWLEAMPPNEHEDTIIALVADHGQLAMPNHIFVDEWPELAQLLLIDQTGEPRTPYFYARQGQAEAVWSYLHDNFSEVLHPHTAVSLIQSGLLGPEPPNPDIALRLGDVIPLMRPSYGFFPTFARNKKHIPFGMHGGLSPDEMRVPWLVWHW
jgi:hypothetical protein